MIAWIDRLLNKITMYRLVLYFLIILAVVAMIFGLFGILPYNPLAIAFSFAVIFFVCYVTNRVFADTFKAQTNVESVYITALILTLIITPVMPSQISALPFLIWAAIWAMGAKYILAIGKKHIFNPAAFAVALTAITINQSASWWVGGNLPMLAFVVIGGLLVVRKIQRFDLVLPFFVTAFLTIALTNLSENPLSIIQKAAIHTPIFFFAFIMLTEPLTTPPTRSLRILYGAFVGILFAPAIHIGPIYSTPEVALLVGNVFSYLISPKWKKVLKLKDKEEVGGGIYNFTFAAAGSAGALGAGLKFDPGQYLEWTLGQSKSDGRGNRRYFTVASSPTERDLRVGVRFYDKPSSFKKTLLDMEPGDRILAGQLAGDFTLPKDKDKKLVFIAGGIGITPFRSMVKYLSDQNEKRSVVLLYSNRSTADIAYREVFDEAEQKIGLKTIYVVTGANEIPLPENGRKGRISAHMIAADIPDYKERMFYISGTQAMVSGCVKTLHEMGIHRTHIKTDFFPGFA